MTKPVQRASSFQLGITWTKADDCEKHPEWRSSTPIGQFMITVDNLECYHLWLDGGIVSAYGSLESAERTANKMVYDSHIRSLSEIEATHTRSTMAS